MRVLYAESPDKISRLYRTLSKTEVLEHIQKDCGYHEIIPMIDNSILLRVYVDIDTYGDNPKAILSKALSLLNGRFETSTSDWAIASCSRPQGERNKISYHILSKRYCMQLNPLRHLMNTLNREFDAIDTSVYWFDMNDHHDNGSFRLPNQSKKSINKPGPPLKVETGDLRDFLVTDVEGLIEFESTPPDL